MSIDQGADERRIAHLLRGRGVGPDGVTRPVRPVPEPEQHEPDWLDKLWDSIDADNVKQPTRGGGRLPDWRAAKPGLAPDGTEPEEDLTPLLGYGPSAPGPVADTSPDRPDPGVDAGPDGPDADPPRSGWWTVAPGYYPAVHWPAVPAPVERVALSPKTRRALYFLSAAGAGYGLGLVPLLHGWIADCGAQFSEAGALVLGVGGCFALAHVWDRRTRHWWPGLAWAARIPLASAVIALGLYAPGAVH